MDIIFKCPECEQELAVDSTGAGSEIDCPSCGEKIVIPEQSTVTAPTAADIAAATAAGHQPINAIAGSAAAKVEMHLRVPVTGKPTSSLIEKANKPLEVAAKETDKVIRVKSIRHTDCIEVGHDKFDEVISGFLGRVGEKNIISISPMTYTHIDIGSQKILTDYAVLVVYRG
jgi:DNA-directed RNA polymerase subunit RPC12/RpoP